MRILSSMPLFATNLFISALVTLLFYAIDKTAECQIVNIESKAQGQREEGFSTDIELSTERKTGNTDVQLVTIDASSFYKKEDHLILVLLERDFGKQKGTLFTDSTFVHSRYRYRLSDNWDWEGFVQADRNQFKRRNLRILAGTGPRWRVVQSTNYGVTIGIAPMWEQERYTTTDMPMPDQEVIRLSHSISAFLKVAEDITAELTAYWQPNAEEIKNFRSLLESAINFKIVESLSYRLAIQQVRDSRPPDQVRSIDSQFKQSLVFHF